MIGTILTSGLMVVLVVNMILDYQKIKKEDDNKSRLDKLSQELKSLAIACHGTAQTMSNTASVVEILNKRMESLHELRNEQEPTTMGEPLQK